MLFCIILNVLNHEYVNYVSSGLGVAVLAIGLFVRVIVSFLAVLKAGLTVREMLFIPLAWLPKATVQVRSTHSLWQYHVCELSCNQLSLREFSLCLNFE